MRLLFSDDLIAFRIARTFWLYHHMSEGITAVQVFFATFAGHGAFGKVIYG